MANSRPRVERSAKGANEMAAGNPKTQVVDVATVNPHNAPHPAQPDPVLITWQPPADANSGQPVPTNLNPK